MRSIWVKQASLYIETWAVMYMHSIKGMYNMLNNKNEKITPIQKMCSLYVAVN